MVQVEGSRLLFANEVKADGVFQNSLTNTKAKLMGLKILLGSLRSGKGLHESGVKALSASDESVDETLFPMPWPPKQPSIDAHCSADTPGAMQLRRLHSDRFPCPCPCLPSLKVFVLEAPPPRHRSPSWLVCPSSASWTPGRLSP